MKAGTIIELSDGRRGTVVYNGLDGVGIIWGEHAITMEDIEGHGSMFEWDTASDDYEWCPEAMLRDPYPSADLECVGEDFEIVKEPTK
jgi:hypothetical protein